ncbi:uncharacterized protein [Palaemon carinicauda]|uniref:uncharacterized protein n=1 Tax=Palaemon carinicauda TaxID=392227 RepID=UPI0035B6283B
MAADRSQPRDREFQLFTGEAMVGFWACQGDVLLEILIIFLLFRFRQNSNNSNVSESSSSSLDTIRTERFSRDHVLTCSVFLENSPKTYGYNPRLSKSDQDLTSWGKGDSFFPKRKVSWAPSNSVKHIPVVPKKRRHSEMTQSLGPINFPGPHCSFSVSSLSTVIDPCSQDVPVESDAAIIKVNKPSQLHMQISKTIAVLDDLNKSLQENHSSSDSPPPLKEAAISTPVVIPNEITKKRKGHKHKFFKPLVKNTEILNSFVRSPSSLDAKAFDELDPLLDEPI